MSAYIVNDETISVIVKAFEIYQVSYRADDYYPSTRFILDANEQRQAIGQSLLNQNYASVNFRYGETNEAHKFEYKDVNLLRNGKIDTGLIVGCIDCYNYQACEMNDYFESRIFYSLKDLKDAMLVRYVKQDGFDIIWGWDEYY